MDFDQTLMKTEPLATWTQYGGWVNFSWNLWNIQWMTVVGHYSVIPAIHPATKLQVGQDWCSKIWICPGLASLFRAPPDSVWRTMYKTEWMVLRDWGSLNLSQLFTRPPPIENSDIQYTLPNFPNIPIRPECLYLPSQWYQQYVDKGHTYTYM